MKRMEPKKIREVDAMSVGKLAWIGPGERLAPAQSPRYTTFAYPEPRPARSSPQGRLPPKLLLMPTCRPILCLVLVLVFDLPAAQAELSSPNPAISLPDAFAGWQLVVNSGERDVTREATYSSAD